MIVLKNTLLTALSDISSVLGVLFIMIGLIGFAFIFGIVFCKISEKTAYKRDYCRNCKKVEALRDLEIKYNDLKVIAKIVSEKQRI